MNILFIGDIFGEAGREAVKKLVPKLRSSLKLDFVIANCENVVNGLGVNPKAAEELFEAKVDVLTSGNHIYHFKEIFSYIQGNPRLLKPLNYLATTPGRGSWVGEVYAGIRIAVINLIGQVFMAPADSPFAAVDRELNNLRGQYDIAIVDMHAETTSEKMAMGRYLDGRVAAVLGTHTHVPTADETIFPGGTAYISDVGMSGPYDSVIGMDKEIVIQKYTTGIPVRYQPAKLDARLSAVLLEVEESNGKAKSIRRIQERVS